MPTLKMLYIGPFPNGMASTNRLLSYSLGLSRKIPDTEVLLLRPSENRNNIKNIEKEGVYNGMKFRYLTSHIKPRFMLLRVVFILFGYFKLIFILKMNTFIILHITDIFSIVFISFLRRIKNLKIYWVRDERPIILERHICRWLINNTFNGYIFMTEAIKEYAFSYLRNKARTFILPITIDFNQFNDTLVTSPLQIKYFCHVGLNNYERDGFLDLVESYLYFRTNYSIDIKLVCIGNQENPKLKYELNNYKQHPYFHDILFLGKKDRVEVIEYLQASEANITTPATIESLGFPSKIAEFLASKRPVITTRVEGITKYLNESNCFLCEPNNIYDIAEKMYRVLTEPTHSKNIAISGYITALKHFNIDVHVEELYNFLLLTDK